VVGEAGPGFLPAKIMASSPLAPYDENYDSEFMDIGYIIAIYLPSSMAG
jgi:hypothetical protein